MWDHMFHWRKSTQNPQITFVSSSSPLCRSSIASFIFQARIWYFTHIPLGYSPKANIKCLRNLVNKEESMGGREKNRGRKKGRHTERKKKKEGERKEGDKINSAFFCFLLLQMFKDSLSLMLISIHAFLPLSPLGKHIPENCTYIRCLVT